MRNDTNPPEDQDLSAEYLKLIRAEPLPDLLAFYGGVPDPDRKKLTWDTLKEQRDKLRITYCIQPYEFATPGEYLHMELNNVYFVHPSEVEAFRIMLLETHPTAKIIDGIANIPDDKYLLCKPFQPNPRDYVKPLSALDYFKMQMRPRRSGDK